MTSRYGEWGRGRGGGVGWGRERYCCPRTPPRLPHPGPAQVLMLDHPWTHVRDTATYHPLCRKTRTVRRASLSAHSDPSLSRLPSSPRLLQGHLKPKRLKHLVEQFLGLSIQGGEHDPAEDARAALSLYKHFRREWEGGLVRGRPMGAQQQAASSSGGRGEGAGTGGGGVSRRASTGSALAGRTPASRASAASIPRPTGPRKGDAVMQVPLLHGRKPDGGPVAVAGGGARGGPPHGAAAAGAAGALRPSHASTWGLPVGTLGDLKTRTV